MQRCSLTLNEEERAYLEGVRSRDRRAYLRERAAALLKVADGQTAQQVALHGLLKVRRPDTVRQWLHHFQATRQLKVRPACRRAFSP
jgi:hypothetical protein